MATLIGDGSHYLDIVHALHDDLPVLVFAHHDEYHPAEVDENAVFICINDPQTRAHVATTLGIRDLEWIHPNAYIGPCCDIDHGTHVNYAVSMTRTTIGHHCTISPGVTICGDVVIGDRVLVGAGAVICDRVTIGDDVTIGAGCVVLPESVVDSGSTIVGVPAKHVVTGVHVK